MKLEARKTCRICNSECLTDIISLGEQNIAAYTPKGSDPKPVLEKFPLELIRCCEQDCGLVQLRHSTPPDILYERYFYRSGINQTMTDNLKEIVEQAISKVNLQNNDIVLDIGCNDGTLLRNSFEKLKETIKKFRLDELYHKNIAYESGATNNGIYSIMDKLIKNLQFQF